MRTTNTHHSIIRNKPRADNGMGWQEARPDKTRGRNDYAATIGLHSRGWPSQRHSYVNIAHHGRKYILPCQELDDGKAHDREGRAASQRLVRTVALRRASSVQRVSPYKKECMTKPFSIFIHTTHLICGISARRASLTWSSSTISCMCSEASDRRLL